jgi:hypothetical protein
MRSWSLSEEKSKAAGTRARKNIREKLKHAFAVESENEPLTAEDTALLEKAAGFIARRRLTLPAVMLLEVLTPLSFLTSQAMIVLEPLLGPFFPRDDYARVIKILSRRDGFGLFMRRIEDLTAKSGKSDKQAPG